MEDVKQILSFLRTRLDEQRLALFIGAGVTATEAGLPSGQELKTLFLKEMGEPDSTESLQEVALRFENERDRVQLFDFVEKALTFRGDLGDEIICPSYKLIADLRVDTVLTTNFDSLFEAVFRLKDTPCRVFRRDNQLTNYRQNERKLLKIHGDLEGAANEFVLTLDDYENYAQNNPNFCHRIESIFQDNTVIFLGYGLGDTTFKYIYENVLARFKTLKMKSFAILASDPGQAVREFWRKRKIDPVVSTSLAFLTLLQRETRAAASRLPPIAQTLKIGRRRQQERPTFRLSSSPAALRKAFAYFISRQKSLLIHQLFAYCVLDTLQSSTEVLDPKRKLGQEVFEKAENIKRRLEQMGFSPSVLPFLDQSSDKRRFQKIQEADFCILIISSLSYESTLNKFYGPFATKKPLFAFVHENFRSRLAEDMVFSGLIHVGTDLNLFKRRDLSSCDLWKTLRELLDARWDEWLSSSIHLGNRAESKDLARLFSFDNLLILAFMHQRKTLDQALLSRFLGITVLQLEDRLAALEALGGILRGDDTYEIRPRGRKVAKALELYSFDFRTPGSNYESPFEDIKRRRKLDINELYMPDVFEF